MNHTKPKKRIPIKKILFTLLTVILVIGGILCIGVALFLPFSSAKESMKYLATQLPDAMSYPNSGLTNGELLHLTSWDLIRYYHHDGNILFLILPLLRAAVIAALLITARQYFKKALRRQLLINLLILPVFLLVHLLSSASCIFPDASTGYQIGSAAFLGYAGIVLSLLGSFLLIRAKKRAITCEESNETLA